MKVILGEFTWQDIVKYQDQDIELEFIVGEQPRKLKTMDDYIKMAAYKGRIMAFRTHLPYMMQHYKNIIISDEAQTLLNKYKYEFIG